MDTNRLNQGEMIAAVSAIVLLLVMFIFKWFGYADAPEGFSGRNAWGSFSIIDLILFVTIVVAIGGAVMTANAQSVNMPVAISALTAGLAILSVVLILFRIIFPPDFGVGDLASAAGEDAPDNGRKIGVFLGLIFGAGIAYGGWRAMQEEGTSFQGEADRLQDRRSASGGTAGPGDPPPPPPPASGGAPPPPSSGA